MSLLSMFSLADIADPPRELFDDTNMNSELIEALVNLLMIVVPLVLLAVLAVVVIVVCVKKKNKEKNSQLPLSENPVRFYNNNQ